ncbi:hypothetical protein D6745_00870 [Candidatus Woesearchaeota archaeon]|nr:MAG: hypothetical protein D6745_00870 [Candidatus Woesearchaeota archaeon]
MQERILHTFEAGRRGKPDELESSIANLLGAHLLELDPNARFDLRVTGTTNNERPTVRVSGELSEHLLNDGLKDSLSKIVLERYNSVHMTELKPEEIVTEFVLKPQAASLASNGNAGDSGNPIAVAYRNTPNHLPWERYLAVEIRDILDAIYQNKGVIPERIARISGVSKLEGLRADGKISVDALYKGSALVGLKGITIAVEHEPSLPLKELRLKLGMIISAIVKELESEYKQPFGVYEISINGVGPWHSGGWAVDEGSREAKPYRDGFASYGVQEDSFSGEDPSKPSGTGTFLARYVAVQIVGNGLADFARVALSYTIGREEVGLNIFTNGTARIRQEDLESLIRESIPLRIKDGIKMFGLKDPSLYKKIALGSDYFHNAELPWNRVVKIL